MTSLMFLFLLIALAYMVQVQEQSTQTLRLIDDYRLKRDALYTALDREFGRDLRKWDAELTPDLTIRFHKPDVLFRTGSAILRPQFEKILKDFFPRYVRLLDSPGYRSDVKELRIEGVASADWHSGSNTQHAFIGNMALSQERARAVLSYVLPLANVQTHEGWLTAHVTAEGLSSSHLVGIGDKTDASLSQRVDFRVMDPLWDRVEPSLGRRDRQQSALESTSSTVLFSRKGQSSGRYSIDAVVLPAGNSVVINGYAHPVVDVDRSEPISISGWATDQGANVPASAVYMRFDGGRLIKANYGTVRDDVALALHLPGLNHVGFIFEIPANGLATGEHSFDFIILNSRGKSRYTVRNRLTLNVQ